MCELTQYDEEILQFGLVYLKKIMLYYIY